MTILTSIVVFLLIILLLVSLLLFVKNKLTPAGDVKIVVNDEKELVVPIGGTVLSTLQSSGIFLSSACGGSGSCGQCRLQVLEGGGEILPTETGFFTRNQIKDHWRLGCQTKVKDNLNLRVSEEVFGVKEWECEVISNYNVASFIKEFKVKLPEGEHLNFKPGSYIQIQVPKYEAPFKDFNIEARPAEGQDANRFQSEWDKFKLWGLTGKNTVENVRAYSMANYPAEGDIVMLNIRIATPPFDRTTGTWKEGVSSGICSSYIFSLKAGDKVRISGPYGDFHILDTKREMLYIGGGAGMAPLRSQLLHLFHTLKTTDRKISYWYGARSKNEIFYEEDFRAIEKDFPNFSFHIALSEPLPEDNWTGYVGFIHQVIFDNYLSKHDSPEDIEYYMCGPGPMANAVKKMLDESGVPPEMLMFDDFG
ncbi:MAG: Na(+)-translocating NADH-quinone reductase subunit F [Candidatus Ordinivivax streblomastigis]|uniref:Na(+)-translocating NADH-quinone reductase subunit F n=1 Tax=Candidatus Ordinivivax streblomastigis TaxID=2540710 RepID=A0A5M8P5D7_9BACT|nr:MAG: Na(+)-translocating NADH-quinone reductase subunit F [Candidatus Ordinivivax streblomastigis]